MKAYIAGKLCTEDEREFLEEVDKVCKESGFETFLPHRDVGLARGIKDVQKVFNGDIKSGFRECDIIIADLNGLHVGAGTAWELGYAYAKGIPTLGIKTDESIADSIEYLSSILIGSMKILSSLEELKKELKKFKQRRA